MKPFRRCVAVLLAVLISMQSATIAYAEAAQPTAVQTEDGVSFTHNADGTVTATVYPEMGISTMAATPMANLLEEQGNSYINTGDHISLRLEKTYIDGEMLVSMESEGTGISFYPETTAGQPLMPELESAVSSDSVLPSTQETQESNALGMENEVDEALDLTINEEVSLESKGEAWEQGTAASGQAELVADENEAAQSLTFASEYTGYKQLAQEKVATLAYIDTGSGWDAHCRGVQLVQRAEPEPKLWNMHEDGIGVGSPGLLTTRQG